MLPYACFGHMSRMGFFEKLVPWKTHLPSTQTLKIYSTRRKFAHHNHHVTTSPLQVTTKQNVVSLK